MGPVHLRYRIHQAVRPPSLTGDWEGPTWGKISALAIDFFHPHSSRHRPTTQCKLLYDHEYLYVYFLVHDRYVRSVHTLCQSAVCKDSCVEFFVAPLPGQGYLNFEINAGGTLLVHRMEEPKPPLGTRIGNPLSVHWTDQIQVFHSLPRTIEPEITTPTTWHIEYAVPWTLFSEHVPECVIGAGAIWQANFYKCGDQTSHPHWASWAPIGDRLDFHVPSTFQPIEFVP